MKIHQRGTPCACVEDPSEINPIHTIAAGFLSGARDDDGDGTGGDGESGEKKVR